MGEVPPLRIVDEASVHVARDLIRSCALQASLPEVDLEWMLLAVTELAHNQLEHATDGTIGCDVCSRAGVAGIEIEARDAGPGIERPSSAFAGHPPTNGLGVGLASIRRAAAEVDVDIRFGESTTVFARRFADTVPTHPDVAILGRGCTSRSGDHALWIRTDDALHMAVVDGSGHGEAAAEVAARAVELLRSQLTGGATHVDALAATHQGLRRSRGAAATIAVWRPSDRTLEVVGVGNVSAHLHAGDGTYHGFAPNAGMLGQHYNERPRVHRVSVEPRSTLVLHTDGVAPHLATERYRAGRSALRQAEECLSAARDNDDALVLVAK
ncbi:MAG: SpoIIE family protein phosphatase [Myxococcales bacterium]|nr:SpoIIE family protein phosphatase [Myxococcales bacterium]